MNCETDLRVGSVFESMGKPYRNFDDFQSHRVEYVKWYVRVCMLS